MSNLESVNKYRNTIKGKSSRMWNDIKKRLKYLDRYRNVQLKMTREEFISWVVPKLEIWTQDRPLNGRDGASLDRVDNAEHYELSNLQLLSYRDNCKKQGKRYKTPKNKHWCSRCQAYLLKILFHNDKSQICKECNKVKCRIAYQKRKLKSE